MPSRSWFRLGRPADRRPPFRPAVEQLDERRLLSAGLTLTSPLTFPGSLSAQDLTVTVPGIQATAGQPFSGVVALVAVPGGFGPFGKLTTVLDWGDGSGSQLVALTGPDANGLFEVQASHTYLKSGSLTLTVSVEAEFTGQTVVATGPAAVAANPNVFTASGVDIAPTAGTPFNGVIAALQDSAYGATGANVTATVNWGDGSPLDTALVQPASTPGFFEVVGQHTYLTPGSDQITVWLRDNGTTQTAETGATALVGAPTPGTLTVTPVAVMANAGQPFSGVVAVIQTSLPGASLGNLSAVVNWGDGTAPDTVALQPTSSPGFFQVVGSHQYAQPGTETINVWVQDAGQGTVGTASTTATVAPAAVTPPADTTASPPQPTLLTEPVMFLPTVRHHHRHLAHRRPFRAGVFNL